MSRSVTEEELRQFEEFVEKRIKEVHTKEDSIKFLHKVGFCDKNGVVSPLYKSSRKK